MPDGPRDGGPHIIGPHGGYRNLRSYQVATIVYDATVGFCNRFIPLRSRTHDQMVQAARSAKQNLAEGSTVGATFGRVVGAGLVPARFHSVGAGLVPAQSRFGRGRASPCPLGRIHKGCPYTGISGHPRGVPLLGALFGILIFRSDTPQAL
jgi:hypothetical protein